MSDETYTMTSWPPKPYNREARLAGDTGPQQCARVPRYRPGQWVKTRPNGGHPLSARVLRIRSLTARLTETETAVRWRAHLENGPGWRRTFPNWWLRRGAATARSRRRWPGASSDWSPVPTARCSPVPSGKGWTCLGNEITGNDLVTDIRALADQPGLFWEPGMQGRLL